MVGGILSLFWRDLLFVSGNVLSAKPPTGYDFYDLKVKGSPGIASWKEENHVLLLMEENPAPVEVGSLSHDLQGFSTIPGGSTLAKD